MNDLGVVYTPSDGISWKRSDYYRTGIGEERFSVELIETEIDVVYFGFKIARKESDFSYSMGAMRPNRVDRSIEFKKEIYKIGSGFKYDLDNILQGCEIRFDAKRR